MLVPYLGFLTYTLVPGKSGSSFPVPNIRVPELSGAKLRSVVMNCCLGIIITNHKI